MTVRPAPADAPLRRTKADTATRGRYANTAAWVAPFLAALRRSPNIEAACRAAGVARSTVYARRETYPEFAAAWTDAIEEGIDELVGILFKRALTGSDRAAMFLLKAHRPAIYRDSYRPPAPAAAPEHESLDVSRLTPDECAELERLVAKLQGRETRGEGDSGDTR